MKRVLVVVLLILFVFAGCSAEKQKSSNTSDVSIQTNNPDSTSERTSAVQKNTEKSTENTDTTNTTKQKPKISKGKVKDNNYINSSLGFKIMLPDGWEYYSEEEMNNEAPELSKYGDDNQEYFITKITEIPTGYDVKSVSLSVDLDSGMKSLDDYKKYVEEHFNDDPDYMHTEYKGFTKIGNRDYLHIKFVYPSVDYVYSDLFVCFDNGAMVYINFSQLNDSEIENFLKNYFL